MEDIEPLTEDEIMDIKINLKKEIEQWIRMKKEADRIKQEFNKEYNKIKVRANSKEELIKQYMKQLGGGKGISKVNLGLDGFGTWEVKMPELEYKPLSKKRLIELFGEEEAEKIWDSREQKDNVKLKYKEIRIK